MHNTASPSVSPVAAMSCWLRKWLSNRSYISELDRAGSEADRMAHDLGMSAGELKSLVARGKDAASLLDTRMESLDLDREQVAKTDPAVVRDLQRLCAMCNDKRECAHDLVEGDREGRWKTYCPNSTTLQALKAGQSL